MLLPCSNHAVYCRKAYEKAEISSTTIAFLKKLLQLVRMAKQIGDTVITGTYDDLCFYKMDGQYYVRMKSSLTRNRVRKSAAFANTMKSANELGTASVLASQVYRTIAKEKRKVALYRKMTGMAKLLLKHGESKERISELLQKYILEIFSRPKTITKRLVKKPVLYSYIFTDEIYRERRHNTIRRKNKRRRRFFDHRALIASGFT